MGLKRELQYRILRTLSDCYPMGFNGRYWDLDPGGNHEDLVANLLYLGEHGLLAHGFSRYSGDWVEEIPGTIPLTAKGIDFLEDDRGLSAILGVVTIKFHDDTIKSLIEAKILQSDLPQPEKKRWTDQLRSLPAEATNTLC